LIYLAHGASGNATSMQPYVDGLLRRGMGAATVQLPRGAAERALDPYRAQVTDYAGAVIGGHSFGGRVASMLASLEPPRGLVLLSYPLHRPGRPDEQRTGHWPHIACPVLLLSGESDPFARVDLLRAAVETLPSAELITYSGVGHGLLSVIEGALDQVAAFVDGLPPSS